MPTCKLDNCPIAKGGRCLEGLGASCPNLIPDSGGPTSTVAASKAVETNAPTQTAFEPLPGIAPLEIAEARNFSRRGPCIVVALIGPSECGKTSLLARLHQLFQAGAVLEFDFAGSRSLPHFEELNWLATVESGASEPRMKRSSSQFDNSFLHLAVRSTETGTHTELLLNDITGETFEKAVATQSTCERLIGLARADHLVILVDGEALAAPTLRHHQIEQTRDFLQRVLQSGQCGIHTALHIVISKLDRLGGSEQVADKMEAEFSTLFQSSVGRLNFWRIAARPMDGSLPTNEHIGKLFASWVRTTYRYPAPIPSLIPRNIWARDFCRYGT